MLKSYKNNIDMITYHYTSNRELTLDMMPKNIEHLIYEQKKPKKIEPNLLPSSITKIDFYSHFYSDKGYNFELEENMLPRFLIFLNLGDHYNKKIKPRVLPNFLTHLITGQNYNQEIEPDVLPLSLEYLKFGSNFNKPIKQNVLQLSLKYLKFGDRFDQKIEELPQSITHLKFGHDFNKKLEPKIMYKSLEYLKFGYNYNQKTETKKISNNLKKIIYKTENFDSENAAKFINLNKCIYRCAYKHINVEFEDTIECYTKYLIFDMNGIFIKKHYELNINEDRTEYICSFSSKKLNRNRLLKKKILKGEKYDDIKKEMIIINKKIDMYNINIILS